MHTKADLVRSKAVDLFARLEGRDKNSTIEIVGGRKDALNRIRQPGN